MLWIIGFYFVILVLMCLFKVLGVEVMMLVENLFMWVMIVGLVMVLMVVLFSVVMVLGGVFVGVNRVF